MKRGIRGKIVTQEIFEKVILLSQKGISYKDIGEIFGYRPNSIYKLIRCKTWENYCEYKRLHAKHVKDKKLSPVDTEINLLVEEPQNTEELQAVEETTQTKEVPQIEEATLKEPTGASWSIGLLEASLMGKIDQIAESLKEITRALQAIEGFEAQKAKERAEYRQKKQEANDRRKFWF